MIQNSKELEKQIATDIFEHYAKETLPEDIFSKIKEHNSYSFFDYNLVDRGFLLFEKNYSIIYEVSLSNNDEQEEEYFFEPSYCINYLFIDHLTKSISDINALFDSFSVDCDYTIKKALEETKKNYIEIIRRDIEIQLDMYKQEKILDYNVKPYAKKRIKESRDIIKNLLPDMFFKIPKEIFKD